MALPCSAANLLLATALPLYGVERERALRAKRQSSEAYCEAAGVRYRMTGGSPPLVALWNLPYYGTTVDDSGARVRLSMPSLFTFPS